MIVHFVLWDLVLGIRKFFLKRLALGLSRIIAIWVSKICELVTIRYTLVRGDIGKHTDRVAELVEQLQNMDSKFDNAIFVDLLVTLIDVNKLQSVVAAMKRMWEKDIKWESVDVRLLEKAPSLKIGNWNRASAAKQGWIIWEETNHTTRQYFFKPPYQKYKLNAKWNDLNSNCNDDKSAEWNSNLTAFLKRKEKQRTAMPPTDAKKRLT